MLKKAYTTGEIAKICCVAPRTVSKWFDSGKMSGYRLPGSSDRRVPVESLLGFLESSGMPIPSCLIANGVYSVYTTAAGVTPVGPVRAGYLIFNGSAKGLIVGCDSGMNDAIRVAVDIRQQGTKIPLALLLSDDRSEAEISPSDSEMFDLIGRNAVELVSGIERMSERKFHSIVVNGAKARRLPFWIREKNKKNSALKKAKSEACGSVTSPIQESVCANAEVAG